MIMRRGKSVFKKSASVVANAIVVAILLVSCSTSSGNSTTEQRFESLIGMRDAYIEAGGDCPDWKLGTVKLAIGSGSCSDANVLSIYSSREIANEQNSSMKRFVQESFPESLSDTLHLLVGENWILNDSDMDLLEEFKNRHGGDLITSYSQIP